MACPFSKTTYSIVKKTTPTVAKNAKAITTCFYGRLFKEHPVLKSYFNQTHQAIGEQPEALAASVIAYASHVDDLSVLKDALDFIAEKHIAYDVKPEQYPIVGENLLAAIKETLGVGDDVLDAWGEAYQVLADTLIKMEADLYKEREETCGWTGYKAFEVTGKTVIGDVTELCLVAKDGKMPVYVPGMYVNVKPALRDEDGIDIAPRSYSISNFGSNHLRIASFNEGLVSGWLNTLNEHDEVLLSVPCGTFKLDVNGKVDFDKVVLLGGGIGATPMVSILEGLVQKGYAGEVKYLQSSRLENGIYQRGSVEKCAEADNVDALFRITEEDATGNHIATGRANKENLREFVGPVGDNTVAYICGPESFSHDMKADLIELGIPDANINSETFGPALKIPK